MKMEIQSAIIAIVEMMLPRFSPQDMGFYVCVEARSSVYADSGKEHRADAEIHFLFQRPNNYTKVFMYVSEPGVHIQPEKIPVDGWKLMGDHDSCWRDGVSSPLFKLSQQMQESLEKKAKKLGKRISEFNNFDLFNSPCLVECNLKELPSKESWDRKFEVKIIRRVPRTKDGVASEWVAMKLGVK